MSSRRPSTLALYLEYLQDHRSLKCRRRRSQESRLGLVDVEVHLTGAAARRWLAGATARRWLSRYLGEEG